ncbi:MAG: DUF1540 domain-containing protein [Clostridia bacterium]|nr:DUF1540 domain-containing protein [Clostridia bacterium]
MTKLGCKVSTCAYHCRDLCSRNSILVDGHRASQSKQTHCSSFAPKDHSVSNSVGCGSPEAETDVSCKAANCAFNSDGICSAREITVAVCGCSDPCCSAETACASFRRSR